MEQTGIAGTLCKEVEQHLLGVYPPREAAAISVALMCSICHMSRSEWYIQRAEYVLSSAQVIRLKEAEARLKAGEPLQYVLGEASFGPFNLSVGRGVLIPRPETEELCNRIVEKHVLESSLRILDLGTGSAAIPLYLAYYLKDSSLYGVEKSSAALVYAHTNVTRYERAIKGAVKLIEGDMTQPDSFIQQIEPLDILVSNPPYVAEAERKSLAQHVLSYEPQEALFAFPHQDDLYYFRAIAALLPLLPKRLPFSLYLEINSLLAEETLSLLRATQLFLDLQLVKDLSGKQRFVMGIISNS